MKYTKYVILETYYNERVLTQIVSNNPITETKWLEFLRKHDSRSYYFDGIATVNLDDSTKKYRLKGIKREQIKLNQA